MRATAQDAYNSLTLRNTAAFLSIIFISAIICDAFGYLVFRRFPVPIIISFVAVIGWRIGRLVGHVGLSKLLNAASVGLGCFAIFHLMTAVADGYLWPSEGYLTWGTHITMWGWIAFHLWRAYKVLRDMPPDHRVHVTEGTETVWAQMTYRQAKIKKALENYEDAKKLKYAVI